MATTVNKIILIGNLGDDVKMHYFDKGSCLGRFPIATSESYINKQTGEKVTSTDWHNIVVRNKLAEFCEKYLSKGDKVYCEGKLKNRKWEQDGIKRYSTEIHVFEMSFLSTKKSTITNNQVINSSNTSTETPQISSEKNDVLPF